MTPQAPRSVDERIERLERLVEDLQRQLAARPSPSSDTAVHPATAAPAPAAHHGAAEARRRRVSIPRLQWDGQLWLNRLGIGLVLLGTGLLFRYSIEMGWLTPLVRVAFGASVGAVLFALGLRLDRNRRYGAVLLGGGIATWYITGWAAFNLYGLVGYLVAFLGMVAITVLAFAMALGRDAEALAVVGAIGGLGTPLLLGVSYGTPRGFALYTCLILAWTAAVHLYRGWRGLLWTAMGLAWPLLFVYARRMPGPLLELGDRWVVQLAAVFAWAVLGVLPLARRVRLLRAAGGHERHWKHRDSAHWYALALVPPAATLAVAAAVWNPRAETWGYWTLAVAAGYAAAGWALYRPDHRIARALFFAASVMVSAGCVASFGGDALLLALALQALALHWLAGHGGGPSIRWMAHRVFMAAAAWTLFRLSFQSGDTSAPRVLADLAVLAVGMVSSYLFRGRRTVLAYRYFVHVGVMGWLWRELAPFEGGQGLATISWGVYGLALLLYGLRAARPIVERTGIATLLAVVAKLFLVDLDALHPLFRVLLFLGFGAVFLFLSYALQGWWKSAEEAAQARAARP